MYSLATTTPLLLLLSRSGYPPWIVKWGGLESAGRRIVSLNSKCEIKAFYLTLILFLKYFFKGVIFGFDFSLFFFRFFFFWINFDCLVFYNIFLLILFYLFFCIFFSTFLFIFSFFFLAFLRNMYLLLILHVDFKN